MKTKKKDIDPFEYEDFGTPSMYLFSILCILLMLGIIVLFALILASGVIYIGASL